MSALAEALTEAAVNVAHAAQSLRGEAELDPATGHWTIDKESMKELDTAIGAWSAAGDALLKAKPKALPAEPTSTRWPWSAVADADRPLTRHDLRRRVTNDIQAALIVYHDWPVGAVRALAKDEASASAILMLAVAGGEHRFPTAQDCDTASVQMERARAQLDAERDRLQREAVDLGLVTATCCG